MNGKSILVGMTSALSILLAGCASTPAAPGAGVDPGKPVITVLYDAFGNTPHLQKDWGYAALVEAGGKRILFDTGNDGAILAHNAKTLGVDLTRLDLVVMSHRHGDHMGGLSRLLDINPKVRIYAPKEGFGVYGGDLPGSFYRRDASLPAAQQYYGGAPPEVMHFGSAWPQADITLIDRTTEIAPGVHLIALVSDKPGTLELRELSLAIETTDGMIVVVGCSHPGVDRIMQAVATIDPRILLVVGGLHLVVAKDPEISSVVALLRDTYRVGQIAPGHCTGEPTFTELRKVFGERYLYAGVGTRIEIGLTSRTMQGTGPPVRSAAVPG